MKQVLSFLLTLMVLNAVLITIGVATGALLKLVVPSVDRGTSILIGVLSTACSLAAIKFVYGMMGVGLDRREERADEEDDEPDLVGEDERASVEQVNSIISKMSIVPAPERPRKGSRRRR
jgi:hypothetical protein